MSTAFASAISFGVRLRTKSGCLRNCALIAWPGWIFDRSTSVVDSASTSADGFIWLMSGSTIASAPTPAKDTAAILMKSRRRGSWTSSWNGAGDSPGGTLSSIAIRLCPCVYVLAEVPECSPTEPCRPHGGLMA
ncbi:hypothetical protein WR25_13482 [Diploscapter pachys]|uniref:Uncharacterized protein n=1 Tax=Diploscapter pachys TaxID=2018661 RepID=A0A2A2K024_9BILA|nr:hypothetical protein WR25_13482 [Diploscapter pachys]